ncbi:histone H3-K9 methyltransferase [Trema orientale]|uniref:Histone H3-K9 methyltransferase n=1 Tax=Trema orientale TaxID=63057 RepID=A0A2P5FMX9_TREOI|nr:histone H3-K9 methyltransferase [Trema orientale]
MTIGLVFNAIDLFPYRGTFEPPTLPSSVSAGTSSSPVPRAPSAPLNPPDVIVEVLDDEYVTSSSGGYRRFLVCWKDRASTDDTWLTEEEFRRVDPELLDNYLRVTSSESSSFQPGGNDGDHTSTFRTYVKRKYRK